MGCSFISFDGVDGAGKSTQVDLCCDWLRSLGHDVVTCRDPGTTRLGEAVRAILLEEPGVEMAARSEMLLYMASRAQLVEEVIRPALSAGKLVVSDRFLLANVVYQGHAGGLDVELIWQVGRLATAGVMPDLCLLLDLNAAAAAQRIRRPADRMEARGLGYLQRVREGFLTEAERAPDLIRLIDAAADVQAVQSEIRKAIQTVL